MKYRQPDLQTNVQQISIIGSIVRAETTACANPIDLAFQRSLICTISLANIVRSICTFCVFRENIRVKETRLCPSLFLTTYSAECTRNLDLPSWHRAAGTSLIVCSDNKMSETVRKRGKEKLGVRVPAVQIRFMKIICNFIFPTIIAAPRRSLALSTYLMIRI